MVSHGHGVESPKNWKRQCTVVTAKLLSFPPREFKLKSVPLASLPTNDEVVVVVNKIVHIERQHLIGQESDVIQRIGVAESP